MQKQNLFHKTASITSLIAVLLCVIPQCEIYAFSQSHEINNKLDNLGKYFAEYEPDEIGKEANVEWPVRGLLELFDPSKSLFDKQVEKLKKLILDSSDPVESARCFCLSFLDKINIANRSAFTLDEACLTVNQQIDSFSIPAECREDIRKAANTIQRGDKISYERSFIDSLPVLSVSMEKWTVIFYAIFCVTLILIAIYAPQTLTVLLPAITLAFDSVLDKKIFYSA